MAFNPGTSPADAADAANAAGADIVLCMSIVPGYSGQDVHARGARPDRRALPPSSTVPVQVDGGVGEDNARARAAGRRLAARRGQRDLRRSGARGGRTRALALAVSLERALELVAAAPGRGYPNPTVGAVVVAADGAVVGEGVTEPAGERHAEIVALDAAGDARPRRDALRDDGAVRAPRPHAALRRRIVASGIARVVAGCADPNPKAAGGAARLEAQGIATELLDVPEARRQNEAWRIWVAHGRPHVILKLAASLDGRVAVPGSRWVTGEAARRRVHELRALVDAVAVGMGTVRADAPRLDVRDVPRHVSRDGLPSAVGRSRRARSSSCGQARSRTSWRRSGRRASSRCSSKAGRRSRPRARPGPRRPAARVRRPGARGRRAGDARGCCRSRSISTGSSWSRSARTCSSTSAARGVTPEVSD